MYVCAANLVKSRTGRALIAIRDHPIAASAMGINVSLYKSLTFGVSALYTGVAGALGAIAIAVRRARQLHLRARRHAVRRPGGRRRRLDPGHDRRRILRAVRAEHRRVVSKGLAGAVYGVILMVVIYVMPTGAAGLVRSDHRQDGATRPLSKRGEGTTVNARRKPCRCRRVR